MTITQKKYKTSIPITGDKKQAPFKCKTCGKARKYMVMSNFSFYCKRHYNELMARQVFKIASIKGFN
jgi:hypothetical protein